MEDLEKKIMGEITSGRVTLRSRYLFIAEKLGMGSAIAFSAILGSLFVALILWHMKNSETLSYLSFGSDGLLAFWENFPYGLIVSAVVMLLLIGFILKKSGWVYQIPFGIIALGAVVGVTMVGITLTFTTLPGHIGREEFGPAKPLFKPFLPSQKKGNAGIMGQVMEWNNPRGILITPHGQRAINAEFAPEIEREKIVVGTMVMVVGRLHEEIFFARHLRVIPKDRMHQRMLQ